MLGGLRGTEASNALFERDISLSGRNDAGGEGLPARTDEPDKTMEGLRVKVENLERQLCALQRQVQMQGDVSKLVSSLAGRLTDIACDCERRVSEAFVRLEKEVGERVSTGDVKSLSDEVKAVRDQLKGLLEKEFVYDQSKPLEGIIAHLTCQCGGNVHEEKVVNVTSSSCYRDGGGDEPKMVAELGTNSYLQSENKPNQWIRYDFKGRRVALRSYSIRSVQGCRPMSWVLEVSNDGSEGSWAVVDRRENRQELNGEYVTHNFAVSNSQRGSFRFVRLRQIGKAHDGSDFLAITSLELFGILFSE